jgi:hypothetical protein
MLNLFQHLIKSIGYETLKQVQGYKKGLLQEPPKKQKGTAYFGGRKPQVLSRVQKCIISVKAMLDLDKEARKAFWGYYGINSILCGYCCMPLQPSRCYGNV